MRILFSHINHPAQFRRLIPALVAEGHDLIFLAQSNEWHAPDVTGYRLLPVRSHRDTGGPHVHPFLRRCESAVVLGQATFRAACDLKQQGWYPDVIVNHVGFGNGLYLSDVFPTARRVALFEWYYNADGSDLAFLRPEGVSDDHRLRLRTWNAQILLELADVDIAITPTTWQQEQFPSWIRPRLRVIHEGIDVPRLQALRHQIPKQRPFCLPPGDIEVVTYLSRCFEEYRGFPQAMHSLARLQRERPSVHLLLAGSDEIAYGSPRTDGRSWRQWANDELDLDPARTHWLGILQNEQYEQLLQCSDVHLYLTVPFVLSWSLLEAMAAGCAIVASSTAPVLEVMEHQQSGLLVDFWNEDMQVEAMHRFLNESEVRRHCSAGARIAASKYSAAEGLRQWRAVLCEDTDQTA
ncbi:glycosyltransferase [Synechococcus sp. PROS-U-1]|uniref:glycosyltransferase n=1 Tax=Synechococcus sp. PROS-U-1 TaxID=1400866 RepID=UPI001647AEC7|nr:glycosyltransferase [Synechococcus sp. PROS-U-1]QNJ01772.1 glycosyl transferase/ family 1 [Synechococcus sp. PROS-U-1]